MNLAAENSSDVKLKGLGTNIEVVPLSEGVRQDFFVLCQAISLGCFGVQLTEESLGAVVLKILDFAF